MIVHIWSLSPVQAVIVLVVSLFNWLVWYCRGNFVLGFFKLLLRLIRVT